MIARAECIGPFPYPGQMFIRRIAAGLLALSIAGCGAKGTGVSADATSATVVPGAVVTTVTPLATANPGQAIARRVSPETSSTTTSSTTTPKITTTEPVAATASVSGAEFAVGAVSAYRAALGEAKAIEITIWVGDMNRAEAELQDLAKPANVDTYEYKAGKVGSPEPVRLTSSDAADLETILFPIADVAWDQLPAMFATAIAEIGGAEGSTGVTHLVVERDLPSDAEIVLNIYVDGGPRSSGGYVKFHHDGAVKRVYGP